MGGVGVGKATKWGVRLLAILQGWAFTISEKGVAGGKAQGYYSYVTGVRKFAGL